MSRVGSAGVRLARRRDVVTIGLRLRDGWLGVDEHAELARLCEEIDLDESVRVVVVQSKGPDFCVGDDASVEPGSTDGIAALGRLRVPCVAAVAGRARDAGVELALACDLRFAARDASFALTQIPAGRLPFHGGTQRLPRAIGGPRAARLLLLGESMSARQACDAGLVQHLTTREGLAADVRRASDQIARRAPLAQRLAKEALRAAGDLPLEEGLRLEGDLYVLLQTSSDRDEGIASFREKRRPRFHGGA